MVFAAVLVFAEGVAQDVHQVVGVGEGGVVLAPASDQ